MDLSELDRLEKQVGTMKLSEVIKTLGYGDPLNYKECVLGRAYRFKTGGRDLIRDAIDSSCDHLLFFTAHAAKVLGAPFDVVSMAERMCLLRRPAADIADYVASQGF